MDIYYYYTYDFIYFIKIDGKKCQDNKCYCSALQKMISFPVQTEVGDGITTMYNKSLGDFDRWCRGELLTKVIKPNNANNALQKMISCLVQIPGEDDRIIIDVYGHTFFSYLCSEGRLELVVLMITKGEDVNFAFWSCDTPLMEACKNGHICIVQILIKSGADINYATQDFGLTALHHAAINGQTHVVKYLINEGADLNFACHSNNYMTPLMEACNHGKIGAVKTLIKSGADVNYVQRGFNMTALSYAAENGYKHIVIILINEGADVNLSTQSNTTPLSGAAKNKHYEIVEILLQNGADVDPTTETYAIQFCIPFCNKGFGNTAECTPLFIASRDGNTVLVELLLKYKANPDVPGPNNETALFAAAANGHFDTVSLLLNKGADPSICHIGGWDPVFVAAYYGHTKIVEILQTYGANLDSIANLDYSMQCSALFVAVMNGHVHTARYLIQKGVNINAPCPKGKTLLLEAATNGLYTIVDLLLKAGAQPCKRCSKLSALCMSKYSQRSVVFSDTLERVIVFNFNDSPNKVSIAAALAEAESAATAAESVSTVEE